MYYSFDGDQVGRRLQTLLLENDVDGVRALSGAVDRAMEQIRQSLMSHGCTVIFAAGDSILATGPAELPLAELPIRSNGVTFSVGAGTSPREALIALAKAKTKGRGEVVKYERP